MAEIASGSSTLASQRAYCHTSNLSLRRFNGNKRGQDSLRIAASGRFRRRDDEKITQSSDSNSENQDEIISLFRRIQSSISKEESMTRKQSSKSSEEKPSVETVLDVLSESRKQMKGENWYTYHTRCDMHFYYQIILLTSPKPQFWVCSKYDGCFDEQRQSKLKISAMHKLSR